MARPPIEIDPGLVEKLAGIMCTTDEIGQIVGCSKDTLERRFAAVIEKGRAQGKMSLKRKQYELAMKGNCSMLIWLGKQHLGQSDNPIPEDDSLEEYLPPESMTDDREPA